jgi:hypothetical protein
MATGSAMATAVKRAKRAMVSFIVAAEMEKCII